jgi:hypothetical protein
VEENQGVRSEGSKDQIGSALNRARELFDFNPLSDQKIEELIGLPIGIITARLLFVRK